jgi:hypothetical protein
MSGGCARAAANGRQRSVYRDRMVVRPGANSAEAVIHPDVRGGR